MNSGIKATAASAPMSMNPVMTAPYLMNSPKEKWMPLCFKMLIHMIPANAPIGVSKAPKLEPIIVLKTLTKLPSKILLNIKDIGMLFTKLQAKVELTR